MRRVLPVVGLVTEALARSLDAGRADALCAEARV
jgi:hypothetical protein